MNLVAQVEEHLRELGWESRKKYPGVKEASERATLQLRTLQNQYVVAVRKATSDNSIKHPTTAMFQNEDILRPFLWAANYPDVSYTILSIVLNAIQLLVDADAITPGDVIHVLRILSIHAHGCTHSLNHAAGATTIAHHLGTTVSGASTSSSSAAAATLVPNPSIHATGPAITGANANTGIGSSILSSVSGMFTGSAIISGFKGTSSTIANAASGALSLTVHGTGYSSSTGHGGHHTSRSWRDDESIAIRILQLLLRIVDTRGFQLTEDIFTASIHVAMILLATDTVLPQELAPTGTGKGTTKPTNASTAIEGPTTSTGPIQSAKVVRRTAASALRQMISTLFQKAATNNHSSSSTSEQLTTLEPGHEPTMSEDLDETTRPQSRTAADPPMVDASTRYHIQLLAYHTMQDIMSLLFPNNNDTAEISTQTQSTRSGPLAQAISGFLGHKLYPPPRTACFDLLVMILRQRVDLFTTPVDIRLSPSPPGVQDTITLPDFPSLLRHQICPNIIRNLDRDHTIVNTHDRKTSDPMAPFSLFLWHVKLIATIVELYGHASHAKAVDDAISPSNESTSMENESKILLSRLSYFITEACDKIRDSGTFEDGFIFNGLESYDTDGDYVSEFNIPLLTYWRASVCLEFFYSLFSDRREIFYALNLLMSSTSETDFFTLVTSAAADFATVSASCRRGISSIVRFCESENTATAAAGVAYEGESSHSLFCKNLGDFAIKRIDLSIISKSRDYLKNYDEWATVEDTSTGSARRLRAFSEVSVTSLQLSDQLEKDNPQLQICDIGESSWVAFNCVLLLAEFLSTFTTASDDAIKAKLITKSCSFFVPSLAALQHFMKRFPGSPFIMRSALSGYILLAKICFPLRYETEFHRKVLLGSLSSLSLSSAIQSPLSSSMSDQQLLALTALLYVTHMNHDHLEDDWMLVLSTLERVMGMTILRSDGDGEWSQSIGSCFCRLAQFSSCLSNDALLSYIKTIFLLYHPDSDSFNPEVLSESKSNIVDASNKREGGRMGMFHRTLTSDLSSKNLKPLGWSFYEHAQEKLVVSKLTRVRENIRTVPFSLILLALTVLENSFRFEFFMSEIVLYMREVIEVSQLSHIRLFALDLLSNLASFGLSISRVPLTPPRNSSDEISTMNDLFQVSTSSEDSVRLMQSILPAREFLMSPLCATLSMTKYHDIAEASLISINSILEVAGHDLSAQAWVCVIDALSSASGGLKNDSINSLDRTASSWTPICNMAFRSLKLIVDDYLNDLLALSDATGRQPRSALLDCCAAFGSSEHDVNTSLTAAGMLWTIADQDATSSSLHHVMSKLAVLATDSRQEVRNCSVNTLFSCLVGLGQSLNADQWRESIETTTFGIIEIINAHVFDHNEPSKSISDEKLGSAKDRYQVTRHHSRDSVSKQWIGTLVLALRGWDRIIRLFFHKLLTLDYRSERSSHEEGTPIISDAFDNAASVVPLSAIVADVGCATESIEWFDKIWSRTLDWAYSCSTRIGGREMFDLRLVGTDLLLLCAQISSENGIQAIITPARVGTNMQVVNGALKTVRDAHSSNQSGNIDVDLDDQAKCKKANLFYKAFNALMRYESFLNDEDISLESESISSTSHLFVETGLFYLLTKLSQGLSKLYECCCKAELSSNIEGNEELNFLKLILKIVVKSSGPQRAKYLNQAQRVCIDLLQSMASQSSIRALETLTIVAESAFFSSVKDKGFEFVEIEAAKIVCDILGNPSTADIVKVRVVEKIIELFDKQANSLSDNELSYPSYTMLSTVLQHGLKSLGELEKAFDQCINLETAIDVQYLDTIWTDIFSFYRKLLSSSLCMSKPLIDLDDLVEMVANLVKSSPWRKREDLVRLLSSAALDLVLLGEIGIGLTKNLISIRIQLFRNTYTQLSKLAPYSSDLQTISSTLLSTVVHNMGITNESENLVQFYIEVGLIICRAIYQMSEASILAASVFSQLCILSNTDYTELRHEANNVLSKIDVAGILRRNEEIQNEKSRVEQERIRADTAETRLRECQLQMDKLTEEIAKLKERNVDLQRQVSMLCDGSIL